MSVAAAPVFSLRQRGGTPHRSPPSCKHPLSQTSPIRSSQDLVFLCDVAAALKEINSRTAQAEFFSAKRWKPHRDHQRRASYSPLLSRNILLQKQLRVNLIYENGGESTPTLLKVKDAELKNILQSYFESETFGASCAAHRKLAALSIKMEQFTAVIWQVHKHPRYKYKNRIVETHTHLCLCVCKDKDKIKIPLLSLCSGAVQWNWSRAYVSAD